MVPCGRAIYNNGAMSVPDDNLPARSCRKVSLPRLTMAIGWALVVAVGGGFLCGLAVSRYGTFGAVGLAVFGVLGGSISHKITRGPSKVAALALLLAMVVAFFVAETCWIRWNTENGELGWWAAITTWPAFIREKELAALIGAACAVWGAWSAYGCAMSPAPPHTLPTAPAPPRP